MELFEWLEVRMKPEVVHSVDFMYDEMESQSAFCLPIIYQPFDATKRSHWCDRGSLFDFLYATRCEDKRVLDFGPGDGWPSLIISPYVREVIGVDGSQRRVSVCEENAKRLGVKNALFTHVVPARELPFEDETFDAIIAASSVEQTPNPKRTIEEFYRVLKRDGRLRLDYEALSAYRNGKEKELFFDSDKKGNCVLTIYDRNIDAERAVMYKIRCATACRGVFPIFLGSGMSMDDVSFDVLSVKKLDRLLPAVVAAKKCTLTHPSARTFSQWLQEVGFREVHPSRSGASAAGGLYDTTPERKRTKTMEGVDELLKPVIKEVIELSAPIEGDPLITAVK